jgi:hypothetical protein
MMAVRIMAANTTQSGGSSSWCLRLPRAPDKRAVDQDRVGPLEIYRAFRRRMHRKRVGNGDKPGIEGAPRHAQRSLRFQHDCKFRNIKTADVNQRPGAFLRRYRHRMRKGASRKLKGRNGGRSSALDDRRRRFSIGIRAPRCWTCELLAGL